ncbi:hypothetical protein D3C74_449850 [compost metagenome]
MNRWRFAEDPAGARYEFRFTWERSVGQCFRIAFDDGNQDFLRTSSRVFHGKRGFWLVGNYRGLIGIVSRGGRYM